MVKKVICSKVKDKIIHSAYGFLEKDNTFQVMTHKVILELLRNEIIGVTSPGTVEHCRRVLLYHKLFKESEIKDYRTDKEKQIEAEKSLLTRNLE